MDWQHTGMEGPPSWDARAVYSGGVHVGWGGVNLVLSVCRGGRLRNVGASCGERALGALGEHGIEVQRRLGIRQRRR